MYVMYVWFLVFRIYICKYRSLCTILYILYKHECMKRRALLETEELQLMKTRRQFINKMMENIFYIRFEPRSDNDPIVTDLKSGI